MASWVLKQKYENSYQVVSICTKFTIFTEWYDYHGIEMCDTKRVHNINMNMLIYCVRPQKSATFYIS